MTLANGRKLSGGMRGNVLEVSASGGLEPSWRKWEGGAERKRGQRGMQGGGVKGLNVGIRCHCARGHGSEAWGPQMEGLHVSGVMEEAAEPWRWDQQTT